MSEFKKGNVVQLKSGGPKMTIRNIGKYDLEEDECAACDWFVQDKAPWKTENKLFPLHALKKLED